MRDDDDIKSIPDEGDRYKLKSPTYRSGFSMQYAIFRIGKKFKNLNAVKGFERHMERLQDTPNADKSISNEILIGNEQIYETVKDYMEDCFLRTNSVIAREILLTASPNFFKGLMQKDLDKWVEQNIEFIKKEFGKNCVYATLHKDETTFHIHALIVPKFWDEKKKRYILSNTRYFDGIEKLRAYQDRYSEKMQENFKSLQRGVRFSKAKHIEIRQFYELLNNPLKENDINQLAAKAKNEELVKIKLKAVEQTLNTYKEYSRKTDLEKTELIKNNKELTTNLKHIKAHSEEMQQAIQLLSEQYKIPQNAITRVLDRVKNDLSNEKEK